MNLLYHKKNMKILFLAAYSELAAASRIKVYQFLPLLEKRGITCKTICFVPSFLYRIRLASAVNKNLLLVYYPLSYITKVYKTFQAIVIASRFDIVFINEPVIPFGLEKLLKLANKNIILQFSDAVFLDTREGATFFERLRLQTQSRYWKRTAVIAKCCLADNGYTKSAVLPFCPDAQEMPGPVDTVKYFFKEDSRQEGPIIIGWVGTPFNAKYLQVVKDAFKELHKKYDVILRLVGPEGDFGMEGVDFELKEWKLDAEVGWLSTFDIGIMPLTDDPWTKGKAGYKLLQYMSMGIPPVASSVGFNKELIQDGTNGFLAGSTEEWVKKLSLLIESAALRKEMGARARATIEERYSLHKAEGKLVAIFENIINNQ